MKTTDFAQKLLRLILCNTDLAGVGDAGGLQNSATAGSLYFGLHTADPTTAGDQTTNETTYGAYARKAVARADTEFDCESTPGSATNVNIIDWPTCTSGSAVITHWSIGTASAGAGVLLYRGAIGAAFLGTVGVTSGDAITIAGNTLVKDDPIQFYAAGGGVALPGGITEGTTYYVLSVTGEDITISTAVDGSVVTITTAGAAICIKPVPFTVSVGSRPAIAAGALLLVEA